MQNNLRMLNSPYRQIYIKKQNSQTIRTLCKRHYTEPNLPVRAIVQCPLVLNQFIDCTPFIVRYHWYGLPSWQKCLFMKAKNIKSICFLFFNFLEIRKEDVLTDVNPSLIDLSDFDCVLCYRTLLKPVVTPCGHTYCLVSDHIYFLKLECSY